MNSTVSPPPTASESPATTRRLLLVRAEGTRTQLTGPDATAQTVGAGPRCSIRLDGPGLRPLHCVITPTEDGAVIRRWAAETRLNGDDFTEAELSAGDIVRVGSIDLRVIELLPTPPEQDAAP
ncbi:MAG: FHA domain-containing protein, partial [Planctomycetota bacterium]